MGPKSLILSCLASIVLGDAVNADHSGRLPCRKIDPSPKYMQFVRDLTANSTMRSRESEQFSIAAAAAPSNVNVYVHVVASSEERDDGYLSESEVQSEMDTMKSGFNNTGYNFTIKNVDWTINSNWAADSDESGMKKALRKGKYSDLNIYFLGHLSTALGYCYYPTKSPTASDRLRDGCTIWAKTVPSGFTTTHEAGHWFGLMHTFDDCTTDNDMIDDTPACKQTSSCDENLDSCPQKPGKDPVHNFMGYGNCKTEFTKGQAARMNSMWTQLRKGK